MIRSVPTKLVTTIVGVVLAAIAGAGVVAADPDLSPVINTTCSYEQVVAALTAESPDLAAQLNDSPIADSFLQSFLGSSPDQRRQMIQELQSHPETQQYVDVVLRVSNTCGSY